MLSVSVSPLVNGQSKITARVGNQSLGYSSTNLNPDDWLPMPGKSTVAAAVDTERFKYGSPIRLLFRTVPGTSTDEGHPMGGKTVGLVVWVVSHEER